MQGREPCKGVNTAQQSACTDLVALSADGRPVATSLKVAEVFGKQHHHVCQAIQALDCSEKFNTANFRAITYKDARNREKPMYEMTRDGFVFLAMGFTGKKAAQFKEAYIEALSKRLLTDIITNIA